MSLSHSPSIVTSGLTLCLDAANPKSYPGSGNTWTDLSPNSANATKGGGVTYNSGNNGYMSFDGTGYYATNTSKVTVNKTAYTKMAFIYPTSFATSNNIISGGTDLHAFWLAGGNILNIGHNYAWSLAVTTTTMSINNWYFVAATFDTTNGFKIYHNGLQEGSSSNKTVFNGTSNDTFIGAYGYGNNFSGRISSAMIYNRALTSTEILQNFNALRGRYGI
jgi:hypothetical protein